MLHFPSTLNLPRRTDSLNATQTKNPSHKILLTIEEEIHDARRVHSYGQEEDLKLALNMLIDRLGEVSSMLSEAYKTQADLEVQLNVAKSNLQLVISNNEMLEEALKRDSTGNARDVGWRRASAREHERKSTEEAEHHAPVSTPISASTVGSPVVAPSTPGPAQETSRFFKFRFTTGPSASASRPGTPVLPHSTEAKSPNVHHLNSPSLPMLPLRPDIRDKEKELVEELETEKAKRKKAEKDKEELEGELESLSQALFEEANKMVATERIKRADTEEELKEAQLEKEALRSALRLLETENKRLKEPGHHHLSPAISDTYPSTSTFIPASVSEPSLLSSSLSGFSPAHHRRTSSQLALKSAPGSPIMAPSPEPILAVGSIPPPLSLAPDPKTLELTEGDEDEEDLQEPTPQGIGNRPASFKLVSDPILRPDSESPWADVPSMAMLSGTR